MYAIRTFWKRIQSMGNSREMRACSAESDALHLAMGWSFDDLEKPHIMIHSTYGESHPGSSHLLTLSQAVRDGILEASGRPALFCCTDMCDGVAQGGLGGYYSLASRDFMCCMCEIQAVSTMTDGLVLLSSCDKSMPAHLMAAGRLNLPTIVMPGGCMAAGAGYNACDTMWERRRELWAGALTQERYTDICAGACPGAGACQQFATASTMQAMAEALGLALPGSALIPVTNTELTRMARAAGKQILELVHKGIRSRDILTREAFENAITVHAAVGGSTNAIVHLLAAAHEAGVPLTLADFDRIHRRTPYLVDVQASGKYPTEYFWYAGGVPALMWELRELLHLDVLTATGRTLGENLEACSKTGFFRQRQFLQNYGLTPEEIIHPLDNPRGADGGIAILTGNLAPVGAVVKHSAVLPEMQCHVGKAAVFQTEDEAIAAIREKRIAPGNVIVISGWGLQAAGMPELFRISDEIASDAVLARTTAIITDGRYSGCTRGPAIGYVCPEAAEGGPIGLLRTGDTIAIDIPARTLSLLEGVYEGQIMNGDALLCARRRTAPPWTPHVQIPDQGALGIYRRLAALGLLGGNMSACHYNNSSVPPDCR